MVEANNPDESARRYLDRLKIGLEKQQEAVDARAAGGNTDDRRIRLMQNQARKDIVKSIYALIEILKGSN